MTHIRRIRRLAALLAGLAGALLAFAAAAPAALAAPMAPVPPGWHQYPPRHVAHAAAFGGMPGWQIALIAVGTALLAPTAAVLLDRAPAARRKPVTGAAAALHLPRSPG
jgi:hypothetical protein